MPLATGGSVCDSDNPLLHVTHAAAGAGSSARVRSEQGTPGDTPALPDVGRVHGLAVAQAQYIKWLATYHIACAERGLAAVHVHCAHATRVKLPLSVAMVDEAPAVLVPGTHAAPRPWHASYIVEAALQHMGLFLPHYAPSSIVLHGPDGTALEATVPGGTGPGALQRVHLLPRMGADCGGAPQLVPMSCSIVAQAGLLRPGDVPGFTMRPPPPPSSALSPPLPITPACFGRLTIPLTQQYLTVGGGWVGPGVALLHCETAGDAELDVTDARSPLRVLALAFPKGTGVRQAHTAVLCSGLHLRGPPGNPAVPRVDAVPLGRDDSGVLCAWGCPLIPTTPLRRLPETHAAAVASALPQVPALSGAGTTATAVYTGSGSSATGPLRRHALLTAVCAALRTDASLSAAFDFGYFHPIILSRFTPLCMDDSA